MQTDLDGRHELWASEAAGGRWVETFLTALGPDVRARPRVRLSGVLAGFGGGFVGVGLLLMLADGYMGGGEFIVLGLLVVGAGLVVRLITSLPNHDVFADAATGAGIVGVVCASGGLGVAVGGLAGSRAAMFAAAGLFLTLWATRPYRGRPTMFGLGVWCLVSGMGNLVMASEFGRGAHAATFGAGPFGAPPIDVGASWTAIGVFYIVVAALFAGLVRIADRGGLVGLGTGLAFNAIVHAVSGVGFLFVRLPDVATYLLVAVVGSTLAVVGTLGSRRASTWTGGALVTLGVLGVIGEMFRPSSQGAVAFVALLVGSVLIGAGPTARAVRTHRAGGPPTGAGPRHSSGQDRSERAATDRVSRADRRRSRPSARRPRSG